MRRLNVALLIVLIVSQVGASASMPGLISLALQTAPELTPTFAPTPTPALTGNHYGDAVCSWSVSWPEEWNAEVTYGSVVRLKLETTTASGETWTTLFSAKCADPGILYTPNGQAQECSSLTWTAPFAVRNQVHVPDGGEYDFLQNGVVFEEITGPEGQPLLRTDNDDTAADSAANDFLNLYSYTNPEGSQKSLYVECRNGFQHGAVVQMLSFGPLESLNEMAPKVEELSAMLVIGHVDQTPVPTPEPTLTPPTPTNEPITSGGVASEPGSHTDPSGWSISWDPTMFSGTIHEDTGTLSLVHSSLSFALTFRTVQAGPDPNNGLTDILTPQQCTDFFSRHDGRVGFTDDSATAAALGLPTPTEERHVVLLSAEPDQFKYLDCRNLVPDQSFLFISVGGTGSMEEIYPLVNDILDTLVLS